MFARRHRLTNLLFVKVYEPVDRMRTATSSTDQFGNMIGQGKAMTREVVDDTPEMIADEKVANNLFLDAYECTASNDTAESATETRSLSGPATELFPLRINGDGAQVVNMPDGARFERRADGTIVFQTAPNVPDGNRRYTFNVDRSLEVETLGAARQATKYLESDGDYLGGKDDSSMLIYPDGTWVARNLNDPGFELSTDAGNYLCNLYQNGQLFLRYDRARQANALPSRTTRP